MLTVRHLPHLATPELWERVCRWLDRTPPDADGRACVWLWASGGYGHLEPWMKELAQAVCPDVPPEAWEGVVAQRYMHGSAVTPCHADQGHAIGFIFSLGATRTLRLHRVREGAADCGDLNLDVVCIECAEGTAVIMDEVFHRNHHHQLMASPDVRGERISLVFRTGPSAGG